MSTNPPATLNPNLKDFWETPARNRVLYGGRASSKTWDAGGFAIFLASSFKVKFLCTRQFQNRIEESVYTLLKMQIFRFGLQDEFIILKNKIIHKVTKSEFIFYGLWRNIDEIKSLEDVDVCWIEEAHNLTKKQWEILEPTIRKEGSQFWVIFNPIFATDFVYKRFIINTPPNTVTRKINYNENPFLSQTMIDIIEAMKELDYPEYEHVYLGVPKENDDDTIIKRSWLMAAIDAHKKLRFEPKGEKRIGFDIADSGKDKNAYVYAHGPVVFNIDEWKGKEDELLKTSKRTFNYAIQQGANVDYDSIGVGAGAGSHFKEFNRLQPPTKRISYYAFNAGGAVVKPENKYNEQVKNKDMFANLKAQSWWHVADRLKNTYNAVNKKQAFDPSEMISISSDCPYIDQLIEELCTPKKDYDNAGRVKVESKKDLDKRGVDSPNLADAFIMAFAPRSKKSMYSLDKMTV